MTDITITTENAKITVDKEGSISISADSDVKIEGGSIVGITGVDMDRSFQAISASVQKAAAQIEFNDRLMKEGVFIKDLARDLVTIVRFQDDDIYIEDAEKFRNIILSLQRFDLND